jgi:hypothetical protein
MHGSKTPDKVKYGIRKSDRSKIKKLITGCLARPDSNNCSLALTTINDPNMVHDKGHPDSSDQTHMD